MQRLEIHHVTTFDLPETSALTTLSRPGGPPRLLAVGDEDFAVVAAEIDDGGRLGRTRRDDLRPALHHTAIDLRSGSGFEGVKATFSFEDINKIQVSQGPSMSGGTGSGARSTEPTPDAEA